MRRFRYILTLLAILIQSVTNDVAAQNTAYLSWDFTSWSDETVQNLKADAAASSTEGWSDIEKKADTAPTDISKDNCFWYQGTVNEDGSLSANGTAIKELAGLRFDATYASRRSLAIAVNYPQTSVGTYAGNSYLWLGGGGKGLPCFTIPNVEEGARIAIEVESHKDTESRGIELYAGTIDESTKIGQTFTTIQKDVYVWTIPYRTDVVVYNTNGCHIYSIKVFKDSDKQFLYNFENGDMLFTNRSYITSAIEYDGDWNSNVLSFTCDAKAQNNYSFANYDITGLTRTSTSVVIDFDVYLTSGSRSVVTIGDALERDSTGGSSKLTYNNIGAIFAIGSNKTNSFINDQRYGFGTLCDKWLHVTVKMNQVDRLMQYVVKSGDEELFATESAVEFWNSSANSCSQIDVFGCINNAHMCKLDNLSIAVHRDDGVEFTDYVVRYVDDAGNNLKTPATRTGRVGSQVKLATSDTAPIYLEDGSKKYVFDHWTEKTIEKRGTEVLLFFNYVGRVGVCVNHLNGDTYNQIAPSFMLDDVLSEGDTYVYYPKIGYQETDGKYYFTERNGGYNNAKVILDSNSERYSQNGKNYLSANVYYYKDDEVAYFSEVEDLTLVGDVQTWIGWTDLRTPGDLFSRFSQGRGPRLTQGSYFYTAPLNGGTYKVVIYGRNGSSEQAEAPALYIRDVDGRMTKLDIEIPVMKTALTGQIVVEGVTIPEGCSLVIMHDGNAEDMDFDTVTLYNTTSPSAAENMWLVNETTTGDVQTLLDDDLLTAHTVYATAIDKFERTAICGQNVNGYIMRIRVADRPTAEVPTGTDYGALGSPATPLVISPKKDVEISFFMRRQEITDGTGFNDSRDMLIVNQNNVSVPINGIMQIDSSPKGESDQGYIYTKETYRLAAGETYTVYARGTTIRLYGFTYDTTNGVKTATPSFQRSDNTLTINHVSGATVYYTLDDTMPTTSSTVYENSISLTQNCTVRAIAVQGAMQQSEEAVFYVDWFRVEDVVITFDNLQVHMSTPTPNAEIHYTLDGTTPVHSSATYEGPFSITTSCEVKAIAYKAYFNPSYMTSKYIDLGDLVCEAPRFLMEGNVISMMSDTEDATIYYTLDGSEPSVASSVYKTPIALIRNCTVKAIAVRDGYQASSVSSYQVTYFQVDMPSFKLENDMMTISCSTAGATIYYAINGDTPAANDAYRYTVPFPISGITVIKAFAVRNGFTDSDMAQYSYTAATCADVHINYDGRYLKMSTETPGAIIRYTIDGSNPTDNSSAYFGPVEMSELCTVNAMATKANMNNSKVANMEIAYCYDGHTVNVKDVGMLGKAFDWTGGQLIDEGLQVKGKINASDFSYIKSLGGVKHLNMANVVIDGQQLPDRAFAGMNIVSVLLPSDLTQVGSNLFEGCNQLACIVWRSNIELPSTAMAGVSNPNLLLYVNTLSCAPEGMKNNVVTISNGYRSSSVVLQDVAEGNGNFYCWRPFTAAQISYTRNFTMKSGKGKGDCAGWETITLPFDVARVEHETNGLLAPFNSGVAGASPYWLYSLQESGFTPAMEIAAFVPYLICMPNHEDYATMYNQGGHVTFSASNVTVNVTSLLDGGEGGGISGFGGTARFVPAYTRHEAKNGIYMTNRDIYHGWKPGGIFVNNIRPVRPFEAYLTVENSAAAPDIIPIFEEGEATGVMSIPMRQHADQDEWFTLDGRKLDAKPTAKGLYIRNGQKIVVR